MIAIDLTKQQTLHAGPRAFQQINFNVNLDRAVIQESFSLLKKQNKRS